MVFGFKGLEADFLSTDCHESESTAATYVGIHGCVAQCMVLQSLFVYSVRHSHPYILLISM